MATPVSADTGFLSSPRAQRRLMWISAAVFVVGLAVFISVYALRGTSGIHAGFSGKAKLQPHLVKAPPPQSVFGIARTFMETVVQRKNLAVAYPLVGPSLKAGMTRKQWLTGNNPVDPYWSNNVKTSHFQVDWSYTDRILLEVDLVAKPGTNERPHVDFFLGLKKINGRWKVNYWLPNWMPPVQMGPAGGN